MKFKLALVTGASSGIGEAMSHFLASKGIDLIITGRNSDRLNALAQDLKVKAKVNVKVVVLDLAIPEQRKGLIDQIHQDIPDLIINNAGVGFYGEALSHSTSLQTNILNVDGQALLEITLEAARALVANKRKGVILNVSSAAAFFTFPYFAVYSATKAFVNSVSLALDEEMKPLGIRVLVSCPGQVATNFRSRASLEKSSSAEDAVGMLTVSFAVVEMWKQIEQGKSLRIFDWKYRLGVILSKFVPRKILVKILKRNIENLLKK